MWGVAVQANIYPTLLALKRVTPKSPVRGGHAFAAASDHRSTERAASSVGDDEYLRRGLLHNV